MAKKKEVKSRKVQVTFNAVVEPQEGKRMSQKAIKEEIVEGLGGGMFSAITGFTVNEIQDK